MKKTSFHRTHERGFSLIELLVITLLIGILSALALVSVTNYRKSVQGDTAVSALTQHIREIRERAMQERVTYRITMVKGSASGANGDAYAIQRFADPAISPDIPPYTAEGRVFYLPQGWQFGKLTGLTVPDPRGLVELPVRATGFSAGGISLSGQCQSLIFKGDGAVYLGNNTIGNESDPNTGPRGNIGFPLINNTIFMWDPTEGNTNARERKPRAITVLGATGRTQVWRMFPNGSTAEWRVGNTQQFSN